MILLSAGILFCLSGCALTSADRSSGQTAPDHSALSVDRCNIGIHIDEPVEFLGLEVRPDIMGWFEKWYRKEVDNKLILCGIADAAVPMITWEPHNVPLEEISAGKHDSYIKSYFERIRRFCPDKEVLIRFAHEMEMRPFYLFSWYGWQGLDPDVYISAWKHVVTMGRETCPNIRWIWSPNHADEYADPYYPGDEYVDYVGVTLNLTVKEYYYTAYEDAPDYYDRVGQKQWHQKYDKPMILSEFAFSEYDLSKREAYFRSLFTLLKDEPGIRAAVFFNVDSTETRDFKFTDEPSLLEIFYDGIRSIRGETY